MQNIPTVDRRNYKSDATYIHALESANVAMRNETKRQRMLLRAYQDFCGFETMIEIKDKKKK